MSGFFAEHTEERTAPLGVVSALPWVKWLFKTIIRKGVLTYEFTLGRMLENYSDDPNTENCAGYVKAHKYGKAHTFGEVDEAQDYDEGPDVVDSGALIGREIDLMGARGRKTRGAGLLCVVGRSGKTPLRDPNDKGVAHLPAFLQLLQYYHDIGYVKCDNFARSYIKTERGAYEMVGGDCLKMSDDPAVAVLCFEPATGITGLWLREQKICIVGVNNSPPYAFYHGQHFPQATF